ncbi:recombination protein RecR [candidate division WWE3 bacterium RBG_16_52_45]|nr:MAG: recombination protein RecR [candidate division WWE3 bacterium RBG_16_52_45]
MKLPKAIENLIEALERLPGIGPKSAARLGFYLLRVPEEERQALGNAVLAVGREIQLCERCFNVSEAPLCKVCEDSQRDQSTLCVVEDPLDLISFEKTGKYSGVYHVLHGVISPLEHVGPENLKISELISRIRDQRSEIREMILALNPSLEGEATAMYIKKVIGESQQAVGSKALRITRLASGIPTGGDLEYADALTLTKALEGRQDF